MWRHAGNLSMLVAAAFCAACGRNDEVATAAPAAAPVRAPDRIAPGVPHGGIVTTVAITEDGDAALSADSIGGLRLWPSLDGKRPPVPVSVVAPSQLALAHVPGAGIDRSTDDLLAAILDEARTVRLLRLGRDGTVRARVQLPNDVAAEEVVAIEGGVLVRRADQSLEKFDANGRMRGRLVTESGERLTAIAARRGSVVGLVATNLDVGTKTLRWIIDGDELRWGTSITMPVAMLPRSIALSPSHRRVAVRDAATRTLAVYDIDPLAKAVYGGPAIAVTDDTAFGFTDDDHVAVIARGISWWSASVNQIDPWSTTPAMPFRTGAAASGSIADGVVATPHGNALALTTPLGSRYLGWTDLAIGSTSVLGKGLAFTVSATRTLWLDDQLERVRDVDLDKLPTPASYGFAVADHHVAVERVVDGKYVVDIVDLDHPAKPISLGTFARVDLFNYFFATSTLVIAGDKLVHRYRIDPVTGAATELPTLTTPFAVSQLWLTDPARADGMIAVATGWGDGEQMRMLVFREPKATAKTIKPASSSSIQVAILTVDVTGTIFTHGGEGIAAKRGGKQVAELALDAIGDQLTVSNDGSRVAIIKASGITLRDLKGTVQWEEPLWKAIGVTFTSDDRRMLVRTGGGTIVLDSKTGQRMSSVCAWGFGLHDEPISQAGLGQPPVCED